MFITNEPARISIPVNASPWNFVYAFPRASHHKLLLSGWTLNGILSMQTGQPVNVNYLYEGDFNGSGEYFGRPDVVGDPKAGRHFPNAFLNAEAFAVPCTWDAAAGSCAPGTQHFGNLGRNAFTGPSFKQFDFSLVKNTRLREGLSMQWRIDCLQCLQSPQFQQPAPARFLGGLSKRLGSRQQRPRHWLDPDHGDSGRERWESLSRRRGPAQPPTRREVSVLPAADGRFTMTAAMNRRRFGALFTGLAARGRAQLTRPERRAQRSAFWSLAGALPVCVRLTNSAGRATTSYCLKPKPDQGPRENASRRLGVRIDGGSRRCDGFPILTNSHCITSGSLDSNWSLFARQN